MMTLPEAEQHYQQILVANPKQAPVWCLLGETRLRLAKLPEAAAAYQNALRLEPGSADGHFGLANVCKEEGKRIEAIDCYRRGLECAPDHAEALLNLGVLLAEQGQVDQAIGNWQHVLRLRPDHAQAHHNLGVALAQKGQFDEAVQCLERALALKPDYAEACYNLGNVLCSRRTENGERRTEDRGSRIEDRGWRKDRRGEAVEYYQRAVRIRPGYVEAYHNLGSVLTEMGRPGEAALWLRQAVRLCVGRISNPSGEEDRLKICPTTSHTLTPSCYNQLGLALQAQAKYDEAEACYYRALGHQPAYAEAHSNLGNLFQEQGRLTEALACYELALVHEPESAPTHWNRALACLQVGDYERGWREYEWRWQRKHTPPRPFRQPRWDGTPLHGRTLLIYMEQGLGDMLQFIRYAASIREAAVSRLGDRATTEVEGAGKVVAECPAFLIPLLSRCRGIDQLVAEGTPLPDFDVQVPLMSLPALLGTTVDTIPAKVPYLLPDAGLVEEWRQRLKELMWVARPESSKGVGSNARPSKTQGVPPGSRTQGVPPAINKIGIVWQGNPHHSLDRYRSIPLQAFAPLARVPGVQLISLQKGTGSEQIDDLAGEFSVRELPGERDTTAGAFMDTAAIMTCLDLVISVDTATAHLAGGLGVPVWVPLSAIGEWRWLLDREDTPWYPTMRLFRQRKPGQWREVFRRMTRELAQRIQTRRGTKGHQRGDVQAIQALAGSCP